MAYVWEKVGPGRYAASYQGHVLQIIKNPDFPDDPRRYQPVVDSTPIDTPRANLKTAQSVAMRHVMLHKAKGWLPPPEPLDGVFTEVPDPIALPPPPVPDPEPEPEPAPEPRPLAAAGTFTITGRITDPDLLDGVAALRQLLTLMREHADVTAKINMPPELDL